MQRRNRKSRKRENGKGKEDNKLDEESNTNYEKREKIRCRKLWPRNPRKKRQQNKINI